VWDEELVDAATAALVGAADGKFRTVGAAVRNTDDTIHVGVNLFHFVGGPCAEMVALANTVGHAARIVAVGDEDRGVVAPCGRCRQIMIDLFPQIEVLLPNHQIIPVADLMPGAYRWSEASGLAP